MDPENSTEKIAQVKKERETIIRAMEKLPPTSPVRQTLISPNGFDAAQPNGHEMTLEEKTKQIESSMLEMVGPCVAAAVCGCESVAYIAHLSLALRFSVLCRSESESKR